MGDGTSVEDLRKVVEAATPGPWWPGDVWLTAGLLDGETCAYCEDHGEPEWEGVTDINGTRMQAHMHRDDDPYGADHLVSAPSGLVAGNYDWDTGGLLREADTRYVTTFDPSTVSRLLDAAEAVEKMWAAWQSDVLEGPAEETADDWHEFGGWLVHAAMALGIYDGADDA